uniref:hypothetical protein n=1 Tax=Aeromonas salmonicida TaxID=645 RepID=UPI003450EE2C
MSLEHGILNVPLAKRNGDMDKQLAQFTHERTKARKGAHKEAKARYRDEKAIAQRMLDIAGPQLLAEWAVKKGMTERAFRTFLVELINDKPGKAKKVLELIVQNGALPPHTQPTEDIAKAAVRGQLFASISSLNAVSKALGFDQSKIYVTLDGQQIHVAEKVASDNLVQASGKAIMKAVQGQEKIRDAQQLRRIERIKRGRTRGAGAGGFNRDIGNIEHRINDANTKISLLQGELKRRISTTAVQWQAK